MAAIGKGDLSLIEVSERAWREAAHLFGHRTKLSEFDVEDPFNPGNRLVGIISRELDRSMGGLYVEFVNGKYLPQVIWATPKMHYPFGRGGRGGYQFPAAEAVLCFAKLDGTNVLAYGYSDGSQTHVSYKPRLRPVLTNSRWGQWLELWGEILKRYPGIPDAVRRNGLNLSFEIYGHRNAHLVEYQVALDAALLFTVGPNGKLAPGHLLESDGLLPSPPELLWRVDATDSPQLSKELLIERYKATERDLQQKLDAAGGRYVVEGAVLWVKTVADEWLPLKAKPDLIKDIHFAEGRGLSNELVRQAAHKAIENGLELTVASVTDVLVEDWPARAVESYLENIKRIVAELQQEIYFQEEVLGRYRASGLDIETDKAAVMRHMSQFYSRDQMRKVAWILLNQA